jgi:hypothetical protein
MAPAEVAMTHRNRILALGLSGAFFAALPALSPAQVAAGGVAQCLPTNGGPPGPCATVRAGQTIRLLVSTTSLPVGPITLLFAEQSADGRPGLRTRTTLPEVASRDGGYDVAVPRELCAGKAAASERVDVQHLATDVNEDDGSGPSLGMLTVAC